MAIQMNKKIFASISLSLVLAITIFINVDTRSREVKILDAIGWFIYEETGNFETYKAIELIEITNELLIGDIAFKRQLLVLQDTVKQKASLLQINGRFPDKWRSNVAALYKIQPDELDDWLSVKAKLDLAFTSIDMTDQFKSILEKEDKALEVIQHKLQALNLSIHSIDLSAEERIHYLHRFTIDGDERLSVFELDVSTHNVLSYQRIG
jgi:hypothetical protein